MLRVKRLVGSVLHCIGLQYAGGGGWCEGLGSDE